MTHTNFTHPISKFISERYTVIKEIRDHLPIGFENFSLKENGVRFTSYYEFIDSICSERPFYCSIEFCYAVVEFDYKSWIWVLKSTDHPDKDFNLLLNLLNKLEEQSKLLREFDHFLKNLEE